MKLYLGRSGLYSWDKETDIPILNRVLHGLENIEKDNVFTARHMDLVRALLQSVKKLPDRDTLMHLYFPDSDTLRVLVTKQLKCFEKVRRIRA